MNLIFINIKFREVMDTQEINIRDIPLYPISSAAKLLNISVHTLRMYEKNGLILPYKKESNHRLYSESDIDRLKCIRKAINQRKISINGIKTLYAMIPCWQVAMLKNERIARHFGITLNHAGLSNTMKISAGNLIAGSVTFIRFMMSVIKLKIL